MKKRLVALLCIVALCCTLFGTVATAKDYYNMWVKRSHKSVHMYADTNINSKVLTLVPGGKKVKVFNDFISMTWSNCEYNGYYGYIKNSFLTSTKPKPRPTLTPSPTHKPKPAPTPKPHATPNHTPDPVVTEEDLLYEGFAPACYYATVKTQNADSHVHVRWAPTTSAPCVADYESGVELEVLYENDEWAQVHNHADNLTGFMFKAYLEKVADMHADEAAEAPETDEIASPVHDVASFEELCAAVPNVALATLPEDAYEEVYTWIEGDPAIAQISFAWGDDYYTYRAAFAATEDDVKDIDGVYIDFDEQEVLDGLFKNGFELNLRATTTGNSAVCDWYMGTEQTQYSLFSETGGYPEMRVVTLAELLAPMDGDAEYWALNAEE